MKNRTSRLTYPLYIAMVCLFLCVSGCAGSQKQDEPSRNAENSEIIGTAKQGVQETETPAQKQASETFNSILESMDMRMFDGEKVVEIHGEEEVDLIKKEFARESLKRADPETGSMDGIYLPIHAVMTLTSDADLQNIEFCFQTLIQRVTTVEIVFAPIAGGFSVAKTLMFAAPARIHNRLMFTGKAEDMADMGPLSIQLNADIVHISNLKWTKSNQPQKRFSASVGKLFLAENIEVSDNHIEKQAESLAETLMQINPRSESDKAAYLLKNVRFLRNQGIGLFGANYETADQFERAALSQVHVEDNSTTNGMVLPASASIDIDHAVVKNNISYAFVQPIPSANLTIRESRLNGKVYTCKPYPKYKNETCHPLTLIHNEIDESADLSQK